MLGLRGSMRQIDAEMTNLIHHVKGHHVRHSVWRHCLEEMRGMN